MSTQFPVILLAIAAAFMIPMALYWALGAVLRALGVVIGGAWGLVSGFFNRSLLLAKGCVVDGLHAAGSGLTAGAMLPLSLGNLLIGRPHAARSYGQAIGQELHSLGRSVYRLGIGHPARFLGLAAITEGLEQRLPETMEKARRSQAGRTAEYSPRAMLAAMARKATDPQAIPAFEGYSIERELPAGGSGARLYLATPDSSRRTDWRTAGFSDPEQVVIKSFDLEHGSTLPQIVRENRALNAARRLGLVLEHELSDGRFFYVMPFVPGQGLDVVTTNLHSQAPEQGLDPHALQETLGLGCDLAATLDRFHHEGLWHKDVKPSNLIVSEGRLHVVDLGLVTPLASALTLTTHGTEYYRDPEMVRLAMQGAKVHEVDGIKFDIYSAGAVLYSIVENSFPAHGSLSRITKACPDALAWIIRRCMADMATRYGSADELGRDLAHMLASKNPFTVLPASLPSLTGKASSPRPPLPPRPPRTRASSQSKPVRSKPVKAPAPSKPRRRRMSRLALWGITGSALASIFYTLGKHDSEGRNWNHRVIQVASSEQPSTRVLQPQAHPISASRFGLETALASPGQAMDPMLDPPQGVLLLRSGDVPSNHPQIELISNTLDESGHTVFGLGLQGERGLKLEAQAHKMVGLAQAGDSQAMLGLGSLVERDPDLDLILWVTQSERKGDLEIYPIRPSTRTNRPLR